MITIGFPKRLKTSLRNVDYHLLGVLILMGLLPTVYRTVRINLLGDLPGDWGYNIASQLSWLNVAYEVVHEALLLPMFYLIGRHLANRARFANVVSNGLLLVGALYLALSVATILLARPMVVFMAQMPELVEATVSYIRLEAIALVLATIARYLTLVLVTIKRERWLLAVLALQMTLTVTLDLFLLSSHPFSLQLGVNGIAVTNTVANLLLVAFLVIVLRREDVRVFGAGFHVDWSWIKEWLRTGGLSGLESLVRNAAFILMVVRLVNVVQQQGTYWVTNNFIWGWLLVPILALGELIKRDTAAREEAARTMTPAYFALTAVFVLVWAVSIPAWPGFVANVMGVSEAGAVVNLTLVSLGFYILFAFNNVADSVFYGRGRTDLMLYQSLIVNTLFYGGAFLLYRAGVFSPTLLGIAIMFGLGIAIDSAITFVMFARFRRRLPVIPQKEATS